MNLVFVHLGTSNPEHLWANIRYCMKTFPLARISIVLDHKGHLIQFEDLAIEVHIYERSKSEESIMSDLSHDFAFRMGFWRYSIERIFALNSWHRLHTDQSFIHVESDVLLLESFPWPQFQTFSKLAWLRHNDTLDCAAILFSPSSLETSWLRDEVVRLLENDRSLTDMTALNQISNLYPNRVSLLPTMKNSWSQTLGEDLPSNVELITREFDVFNGLFDPAAIGVWLTGNDPRNRLGWITRFSNHFDPSVNPNVLQYSGNLRREVWVSLNSDPTPLFNLHIHSKQVSYFKRYGAWRIYFDTLTSRRRRFKNRIVLKYTFQVIRSYVSRGNKIFSIKTVSNIKGFIVSRKA